jgi:hypothetical protein
MSEVTCRKKRYCKNYPKSCWNCEDNERNDILEYNFERKPEKNIKIHYKSNTDNYACNYAVDPLDFKMTTDTTKVTCKNCLRVLEANPPKW